MREDRNLLHQRDLIDLEACLAIADVAISAARKEVRTMAQNNDLQNRFTYHPPKDDQIFRYQQIREMGLQMASLIDREVPSSREQSLALTKIEEAVMWANAGIARNE